MRCNAPAENAELTGIYCDLAYCHNGDHEATQVITWASETADLEYNDADRAYDTWAFAQDYGRPS